MSSGDWNGGATAERITQLARWALRSGRALEAIEICRLAASPTQDPSLAGVLADSLLQVGRGEEALRTIREVAESRRFQCLIQREANILYETGRFRMLRDLIRSCRSDGGAPGLVAAYDARLSRFRLRRHVVRLEALLDSPGESYLVYYALADTLIRLRDWEQLRRISGLDIVLRDDPAVSVAMSALAAAHMGDSSEARTLAAAAESDSPHDVKVLGIACDVMVRLGDHEAILAVTGRGLDGSPGNQYLLVSRARALLGSNRRAEAEDILLRSTEEHPGNWQVNRLLVSAMTDRQPQRVTAAIRQSQRVLMDRKRKSRSSHSGMQSGRI